MEHSKGIADGALFAPKSDEAKAAKSLEKLGDGNKAVFEEMYPAYEFYKKHGIEGLKQCASKREPEALPPKVVKGFEKADQGLKQGDQSLMESGAETMLEQEQKVTLQKSAYDDKLFREALEDNQRWQEGWWQQWVPEWYSRPTKVVFSSQCSNPFAPSFEMSGGNLGDPKWRWDYAKGTTQKFNEIAAKNPRHVNDALDGIIRNGNI